LHLSNKILINNILNSKNPKKISMKCLSAQTLGLSFGI
jgi:hypothetical protein